MARKKPPLSLRRPGDVVDPQRAERFVLGAKDAPEAPPPKAPGGVQTSRRPGVQASDGIVSKSLVYRKRTADHRRRMTIYLPEDLSRRLRLYAAQHDQDYSVVLAEALGALLDRKDVR